MILAFALALLLPSSFITTATAVDTSSPPTTQSADGSTSFCYDRLPVAEQWLYDAIDEVMREYVASGDLENCEYSDDESYFACLQYDADLSLNRISLVMTAYLLDHPRIYWCLETPGVVNSSGIQIYLHMRPEYYEADVRCSVEETIKATETAWSALLEGCTSDYEKVRVLHDLICRHTESGATADRYARALQYLLNQQGIDTACVVGDLYARGEDEQSALLGPHIWNAVKLDGKYYLMDVYLDATGGAAISGRAFFVYATYDYFCRDATEFARTHVPYTPGGEDGKMFVALEENAFAADDSHEYFTIYGGKLDSVADSEELDDFAAELAFLCPNDHLMFVVGSSNARLDELAQAVGASESSCVPSAEYGYLMVLYCERIAVTRPPEITLIAPALGSSLSMLMYIPADRAADFDRVEIQVSFCGESTTLTESTSTYINEEKFLTFRFDGIAARQMTDILTVVATGYAGDTARSSEPKTCCIKDYCIYQLKNGTDERLLSLCAELLRYGAAAQLYFDYRVDTLADAELAAAQFDTVELVSCLTLSSTTAEPEAVRLISAMLKLDNCIDIACLFDSEASDERLSFEVWRDLDGDGERDDGEVSMVSAGDGYEVWVSGGESYRMFHVDGIYSTQLRTRLYITPLLDGVAAGAQLCYSVESYAAEMVARAAGAEEGSKLSQLARLCEAMMRYSDAAVAYISQK